MIRKVRFLSDKIRVNITMSKELVDFYQQYADKLGIPRSTAMIIGMSTFKDQQEMLILSKLIKSSEVNGTEI